MRKLELRVDALKVESFETLPARGSVGTVLANMFGNPLDPFAAMDEADAAIQTGAGWHTCEGLATCNFEAGCYTFNGGYTCAGQANCKVTQAATCQPCAAQATVPEGGA
ncbi:MAG TPA: hypothetical protein VF092_29500 [Longimicrobium sp.]